MIDTEWFDVINSRDAWVFIGSGISVDAKLPCGANFEDVAVLDLLPVDQQEVEGDTLFQNERVRWDNCRPNSP